MTVLDDHQKEGKVFKPPMAQVGPLQEVSWVVDMLPEFLWIALLHKKYGLQPGIELATELATQANNLSSESSATWFAAMTSFRSLDESQVNSLLDFLEKEGKLHQISAALQPILYFYPSSPISFLPIDPVDVAARDKSLEDLKELLECMFDKRARPATLVQATAVYIGLATDKVKIMQGVTWLENFESISDYPDSEESRMVGASIRATCLSLFPMLLNEWPMDWSRQFWNRGLEIEPCQFLERP